MKNLWGTYENLWEKQTYVSLLCQYYIVIYLPLANTLRVVCVLSAVSLFLFPAVVLLHMKQRHRLLSGLLSLMSHIRWPRKLSRGRMVHSFLSMIYVLHLMEQVWLSSLICNLELSKRYEGICVISVDEHSPSEDLETPSSTSSGNTFGIQDTVNIAWPIMLLFIIGVLKHWGHFSLSFQSLKVEDLDFSKNAENVSSTSSL